MEGNCVLVCYSHKSIGKIELLFKIKKCYRLPCHTHLIDEFNALQKHVVLVVLVYNFLIHKVPRLQGWVV